MNGTIEGSGVAVSTANGFALIDQDASSIDVEIIHGDPFTGTTELSMLSFFAPNLVVPGTYDDPADLSASADSEPSDVSDNADSGSVTFTQTNTTGSRFVGSYDFTLAGGGSVSGSFDVPIVIIRNN